MRWPAKRALPLDEWRPWFAWRPVKIGQVWVWGETVERRFRPMTMYHHRRLREYRLSDG